MTTEEKATAYAERYEARPMAETAIRAYIAGATEALASQWRSVEDELPSNDADVLTSDENGLHIASYFNGEWYSCDDEFTRNPQMWMPIPLSPTQTPRRNDTRRKIRD